MHISVIHSKLQFFRVFSNGLRISPPGGPVRHNLYKITLKNKETWALDVSGAQFGYPDPLCPWHDYEQNRSGMILSENNIGNTRHRISHTYQFCNTEISMGMDLQNHVFSRELDKIIPILAKEYGGKLNAILKGSDMVYKQATEKFLDQIEDHVKVSLNETYSPRMTMARNMVIQHHLSGKTEDSKDGKESDDF